MSGRLLDAAIWLLCVTSMTFGYMWGHEAGTNAERRKQRRR